MKQVAFRLMGCALFVVATACSSGEGGAPPAQLKEPTVGSSTGLATSETALTVTPSFTTAPATLPATRTAPEPTKIAIAPSVVKRCPEDPEVPLSTIGLSSSTRLITRFTPSQWTLIDGNSTRTPISKQAGMKFAGVNSNQQWFAYYADGVDGPDSELWIASIDGKEQSLVVKNVNAIPFRFYEWVNNETMMAFIGTLGEHTLTERFNPFTLETFPLENISVTSGNTSYAFSPDISRVVYRGYPTWTLYDFYSKTKQPVLPWLETSSENPPSPIIHWTNSGVSIASIDANGLRLVINLPPANLDALTPAINMVSLPEQANSSAQRFEWWSSDSRLLAVSFVFGGKDRYDTVGYPKEFYVLDTSTWVAYGYCLPTNLMPSQIHVSADERFIAWTAISDGSLLGTLVLDLDTGNRAFLQNAELLAWGEVSAEPNPVLR